MILTRLWPLTNIGGLRSETSPSSAVPQGIASVRVAELPAVVSRAFSIRTAGLKELDEDGVVAEVLFPDDQNLNTPPWLAGIAPQGLDRAYLPSLRLAGARAYNRWLAEFCGAASERLIGMIALGSLDDVDAADQGGTACGRGRGLEQGHPLAARLLPAAVSPRGCYEPLWSICEELELVVTVHGSDGDPTGTGKD